MGAESGLAISLFPFEWPNHSSILFRKMLRVLNLLARDDHLR
jgi:hypothetical protein